MAFNFRYSVGTAALLAASVAFASSPGMPGVWHRVHTNEIVRWQTGHGAKNGIVTDLAARTITFLVEATGVSEVDPVEFFLIGPLSDRAYESFAVSTASPADIAAALEAVGVPRGIPVDRRDSRFWPQGEGVAVSIRALGEEKRMSLGDVLTDVRANEDGDVLSRPVTVTGGERDAGGFAVAETNMPSAVFALYCHSPSILQLDGTLDQSGVYGRFRPKRRHKTGDLFELSVTYGAAPRMADRTVAVSRDADLAPVLSGLRKEAEASALYARLSFAPDVPLSRAVNAARAFSLVDGKGIRMNGAAPGNFFYRAFLPDPDWRRREGRIFQPFEVRISVSGEKTFVYVEEDYSGAGMDPVLKPRSMRFSAWTELPGLIAGTRAEKVDVLFVFAPPSMPVGEFVPLRNSLSGRISTFYFFEEKTAAESPEEGK